MSETGNNTNIESTAKVIASLMEAFRRDFNELRNRQDDVNRANEKSCGESLALMAALRTEIIGLKDAIPQLEARTESRRIEIQKQLQEVIGRIDGLRKDLQDAQKSESNKDKTFMLKGEFDPAHRELAGVVFGIDKRLKTMEDDKLVERGKRITTNWIALAGLLISLAVAIITVAKMVHL